MRQICALLLLFVIQRADSGNIYVTATDTSFHFARLQYDEYAIGQSYPYETSIRNWFTDYSDGTGRAMENFLLPVLRRLTSIDIGDPIVIRPDDRLIFRYPFIYTVEPSQMVLSDNQARNMHRWLNRGGFWMLDDFHGCSDKEHVIRELRKVINEFEPVRLNTTHEIFHTVFDINEIVQVPVVWIAEQYAEDANFGLYEVEGDCIDPEILLFEQPGRGSVLMAFNVDLGDAMEWADYERYPQKFSGYTYRLFTNIIVYAMSH